MSNIAYVRVSTIEQNEDRQVQALKKHNIDKWFIEKVSAKDTNRPKLNEMIEYIREGDTIYIHDFSRLARSTKDLLDLIDIFNNKKVNLISNKEQLDTTTATGKLLLTMIGAIYEFERTNLLERQREGISLAKDKGLYKGGKNKAIDKDLFNALLDKYNSRKINKVEFAKELKVSRPTLDKLLKEQLNNN